MLYEVITYLDVRELPHRADAGIIKRRGGPSDQDLGIGQDGLLSLGRRQLLPEVRDEVDRTLALRLVREDYRDHVV